MVWRHDRADRRAIPSCVGLDVSCGPNIPTTAHILGGAVVGAGPSTGVIDARQRVFGYANLLVCDGSAIPANVGVNPSLTIAALAAHAISHVPSAGSLQAAERAAAWQ